MQNRILRSLIVLSLITPGVVRFAKAQDRIEMIPAPEVQAPETWIPSAKPAGEANGGLIVDTSNRQAVADFYHNVFLASEGIAANWTGSIDQCDPGTTTAAYEEATLLRVNYYRAMAGLPGDVVLSATWSAKCRDTALMMIAEGSLSHSPGPGWACWTQDGADAAGKSNLAIGRAGADSIRLYMFDNNVTSVGHRQWVLFPPLRTVGTGSTTGQNGFYRGSNALWVIPDNLNDPRPATPEWVVWPPEGYVPYQVADPNAFSYSTVQPLWSFSLARASFASAEVVMSQGAVPVAVNIVHRGSGGFSFPDSVLVWEPDIPSPGTAPAEDITYTVMISGVVDGSGETRAFGYDVTIIDPDSEPPPTATPAVTPTPTLTPVPTETPLPPVAGDVTGDGSVDDADLFELSKSWSTQNGSAGYNSNADLNSDNEVSSGDLLELMENW